ncbi:MAG: DUF1285 domain-containing protein, partial [Gammaproteobacteria bacterium]
VHCNADHPLRVVTDPASGEPSPYVLVRDGLQAKLARSVFYRLVELADDQGGGAGIYSGGVRFVLG